MYENFRGTQAQNIVFGCTNSENTDSIRQAKGVPPAPIPTLETNK